jgi:hypothetical protein
VPLSEPDHPSTPTVHAAFHAQNPGPDPEPEPEPPQPPPDPDPFPEQEPEPGVGTLAQVPDIERD